MRRLLCVLLGHVQPLDARMRPFKTTACGRCGKSIAVKR